MHPTHRIMALLLPSSILCASLSLLGCDEGGSDADADANTYECETPFPEWETGGDGADVSGPPPAGQARAGRIGSEDQIPRGVKNNVDVGDVMLRNGKVMFVIEAPDESDGYNPFGGEIVHADLVGPDGEPLERNLFGESLHGISLKLVDPQSVTVVADGTDGGDAVVRVVGENRSMPLLDVAFGFIFEINHGVVFAVDYVLEADEDFLEVRFNMRNPINRWAYVNMIIFGSVQGDGLRFFTPEGGFDQDALAGTHRMYGYVGDEISYGFVDAEGQDLRYVMEESDFLVGEKSRTVPMESCTELTLPVIRLVVSGGGAETLLSVMRGIAGDVEPDKTYFDVTITGGGDALATRIHVTDAGGGYVTSIIADGEGIFAAALPAGDYLATAVLDGHAPVEDLAFTVGSTGTTVDIAIPQASTVTYGVVDGLGEPIPAKVIFFADDVPVSLPGSFGEKRYPQEASLYVFGSSASVTLPPGGYTAVASRGPEYEIDEQSFTVGAGETAALDLTVVHSVDSTGLLCGDFHVHSVHSADSSDPRGDKVRAAVAEGVEILVSTDHEWVADYQDDVVAEGLTDWIHGVSGSELTTFSWGHFNVYPQTQRPDLPNNGAVDWYYKDTPEVMTLAHADPLDPIVQINHPRSGSFQGYFTTLGFDPVEGTVERPELWSTDFDALEVVNGEAFAEIEETTARDWFALLNMGLRFACMGNSDTHDFVSSEIGYPRTCLVVGHDDPSILTNDDIREKIRAMKTVVSGGILITAEGPGGEGPGDIVDAFGGTADFHVVVQAPAWVDALRLKVFVDGDLARTIALDGTTADPSNPTVRFDDTLVVATSDGADGWVIFVAEGDASLDPVVEGHLPFGFTSPIYLDADSDGGITPRMALPAI